MAKNLIIANFKSNKNLDSIKSWLSSVSSNPATSLIDISVAPAFPYFNLITSPFSLTSQDVSPYPSGSYTGEVNATQLKDFSVKYCLIGHSERRKYFGESDAGVSKKAQELLESGITPVIFLDTDYIHSQISALTKESVEGSIFVFEPAADIGGTETAPAENITKNINLIKELTSTKLPVLYGGSVNEDNIMRVLDAGAEGAVIASASLDESNFNSLLKVLASHG